MGKCREGIFSKDYEKQDCDCRPSFLIKGKSPYNGYCQRKRVVYKATCLRTNKVYIGNTQQSLKNRMKAHFNDVGILVAKGRHSDTFARHYAQFFDERPSPKELRSMMRFEICSQVNPISTSKSFGRVHCGLCMEERLRILKGSRSKSERLINAGSEIYADTRRDFTRFAGTDEYVCTKTVESSGITGFLCREPL